METIDQTKYFRSVEFNYVGGLRQTVCCWYKILNMWTIGKIKIRNLCSLN